MSAQQTRKADEPIWRLLLGVGVVLGAMGLGGLWYFQDNIRRAFAGPVALAAEDVGKIDGAARLSELKSAWVAFGATRVVPTKIEIVRSRAGGTKHVESRFFLVQVGERWLVAAMPPRFAGNQFVGELIGSDHPLWIDAWKKATTETAAIHQGKLVPYQLNGYVDFGDNWKYGLYVFLGLAGLGGFFLVGAVVDYVSARRQRGKEPAPGPAAAGGDLDRAFAWPKS